ncbi:MAG: hypothetical protein WCL14_02725 [Bacteroidota bacterium]
MKKILLLISFGCFAMVMSSFGQTQASVLSPPSETKVTMKEDAGDNPKKETTATEAESHHHHDHDASTCTKAGCTHEHEIKKDCCKKDSTKADSKPTFMQFKSSDPKRD